MSGDGWIGVGVDLDGTLAEYNSGDFPSIGKPIMPMVNRIKDWLRQDITVKIVTARVSDDPTGWQKSAIQKWLKKHIGIALEVTCSKDYNMIELWDDRARRVFTNTGEICPHCE